MDLSDQLVATYEPHAHVAVRLQRVDPTTATFDIEVEPAYRGTGLGSAALADLVDEADQLTVELVIYAEPDPEQQTLASLVRWYELHGFERVGNPRSGRQYMRRPCGCPA